MPGTPTAQWNGRGYSFEAMLAKLLYGIGTHRQIHETYRQAAARRLVPDPPRYDEALPEYRSINFYGQRLMLDLGADISTVQRELEQPVPGDKSTR